MTNSVDPDQPASEGAYVMLNGLVDMRVTCFLVSDGNFYLNLLLFV